MENGFKKIIDLFQDEMKEIAKSNKEIFSKMIERHDSIKEIPKEE
jgi:hypothetical protein